jgi:hypothetical protein
MKHIASAFAFATVTCFAGCELADQADQPETDTTESAVKGGPNQPPDPNAVTPGALVVSHIVDLSPAGNDSNNLSTSLTLAYGGDYAGMTIATGMRQVPRTAATVHLYLFRQDSSGITIDRILTGDSGEPVCDPCTFTLGGSEPAQRTITIEHLILERTNYQWPSGMPVFQGYAVVKANVAIESLAAHAVVMQGGLDPFQQESIHLPVDRVY